MARNLYISRAVLALALATTASVVASEFTTIDCPGATLTGATSINTTGQIVGYCQYANGLTSAFLRFPNGVLKTLMAKNAAQGTYALDLNDAGVMAGFYLDSLHQFHGFTYSGSTLTEFDVPGSTFTNAVGINSSGVVVGSFGAATQPGGRGYLRDAAGNITTFYVPNSMNTQPNCINDAGEVAGLLFDSAGYHGFIRDAAGNITVFDVPGSDPRFGTEPEGINSSGQVTGVWQDSPHVYHGFTRQASGEFTTFDAPGSTYIIPYSINDSGEVTGNGYVTENNNLGYSFTQSGASVPTEFQSCPKQQIRGLSRSLNS
jgi:probable HAF family extracellular repeat protein